MMGEELLKPDPIIKAMVDEGSITKRTLVPGL
jgi:hypothetical protein